MTLKEKLFLICSFFIMFLGLALFAYSSRKPLCIENTLINKVEIQQGLDSETIFNCSLRKKVPLNEFFFQNQVAIEAALQPVSTFLSLIQTQPFSVSLRVLRGRQQYLLANSQELVISEDLLLDPSVVARGVLAGWIQEKMQGSEEHFYVDVLTEMIFHISSSSSSPELNWKRLPFTLFSYCESGHRVPEHYIYCAHLTESQKNKWSDLALRPYIGKQLYKAYLQLDPKGKILTLEHLPSLVAALGRKKKSEIVIDGITSTVDFLQSELRVWDELLRRSGNFSWAEKLQSSSKSEMEKATNSLDFDVIFFIQFPKQTFAANLDQLKRLSSQFPNRDIAVIIGDRLMVLPEGADTKLDTWAGITADRAVWLRCGFPSLAELAEFSSYTKRLALIENCYPQSKMDFTGYLSFGSANLGNDNPSMIFLSFYLPALEGLKGKVDLSSVKLKLVTATAVTGRLRSLLQWKSVVWEPKVRAYRVLAPIDFIEWYKVPEGYLPEI